MVFITGYIVFNSSSQYVTNDTAYFENSMDYFKERGFDLCERQNNATVILIHGLGGNRSAVQLHSKNSDCHWFKGGNFRKKILLTIDGVYRRNGDILIRLQIQHQHLHCCLIPSVFLFRSLCLMVGCFRPSYYYRK